MKPKRRVQLPYRIGDTVYHVSRENHIVGTVVGFEIYPGAVKTAVSWGDQPTWHPEHFACELSTEYEPQFTPRMRD